MHVPLALDPVKFVVLGLSHKSAPLDVREQVFIPETGVGECVRRLIDHDLIESGGLLSTGNRTELYAIASANDTPDRLFESFGLWPHQLPFEAWQRYAYRLTGDDAMDHVFRVAGGLDSLMIGGAPGLGSAKGATL